MLGLDKLWLEPIGFIFILLVMWSCEVPRNKSGSGCYDYQTDAIGWALLYKMLHIPAPDPNNEALEHITI